MCLFVWQWNANYIFLSFLLYLKTFYGYQNILTFIVNWHEPCSHNLREEPIDGVREKVGIKYNKKVT